MSNQSIPTQTDRRRTIEVIKTPLHFYALALLIVEAFLGMVLIFADLTPVDKMKGMYIGVGLFVLVIIIVTYFVRKGPEKIIYLPEHHLKEKEMNMEESKFVEVFVDDDDTEKIEEHHAE